MTVERANRFPSILFLCFILIAIFVPVAGAGPDNKVLVLEISEAITPASDDIIANALAKAENEGFETLVLWWFVTRSLYPAATFNSLT